MKTHYTDRHGNQWEHHEWHSVVDLMKRDAMPGFCEDVLVMVYDRLEDSYTWDRGWISQYVTQEDSSKISKCYNAGVNWYLSGRKLIANETITHIMFINPNA